MTIERPAVSNVTSMLARRQPGASFATAKVRPTTTEPEFVLLPDMTEMNARQVVETIASTLANT